MARLQRRRHGATRGSVLGLLVMVTSWFVGVRIAEVVTLALPLFVVLLLCHYLRCPRCDHDVASVYLWRALEARRSMTCPACNADLSAFLA
ncbi:MAG: hypothetical protein MUE69_18795 [Myxococcota bacterium]|nr:hypothetical protein [Myxococcota bacterium]